MAKQTVLVVDDEPAVLESIQRQLQGEFEVVVSTMPSLSLAAQGGFDAVIADYAMPSMNGVDFLATVRKVQPTAARLLLTGGTSFDIGVGAVNKAAVHALLQKPISKDQLSAAIHSSLAMRGTSPSGSFRNETRKVMIVDDSEAVVEMTQLVLREAGFSTIGVTDPFQVQGLLRLERPNVMLLDVYMPALDGSRLLATLREYDLLKATKVLLYSSMPIDRLREEALRCGAHGFLRKDVKNLAQELVLALGATQRVTKR